MRQLRFRYWNGGKILNQEAIINHLNKYIARNDENLMQFTGLLDKLGKEIYEGDVMLWENSDGEKVKDKVVFFRGAFRMRNMSFTLYDYMDSNIFEVIGNIYEHSHLLDNN